MLGAALLFVKTEFSAGPDAPPSIIIDENRLQALRDSWLLNRSELPNLEQQRFLLALEVEDQMLLNEARKRGFDQLPVVQRRLQQLGGFLTDSMVDGQEQQSQQAESLGLEFSDPLIRTYMINAMRERLSSTAVVPDITEQDIADYYQQHAADFVQPRRVSFSHIYVGGLSEASLQKSHALTTSLNAPNADLDALVALGNPFYSGHQFNRLNEAQLSKQFGSGFAQQVIALPVAQWSPPIASSYGYHRVWLSDEQGAQRRPLKAVSDKIRQIVMREKREQAVQQTIQELLASYHIETPVL